MTTEMSPVMGADDHESALNGSLSRKTSLDDPFHDVTLTWSNLNVYVVQDAAKSWFRCCRDTPADFTQYKQILHNVSGIAKPGQLLAILGASGAGKTTLLNVLNQRNISRLLVEGKLLVNGVQVGDATAMGAMSGYVQQDDLFIGTLTVAEHLWFQAMLRMDRHLSNDERNKKVDEAIYDLGLTKCAKTLIGNPPRIRGISCGERKRLAFASEALTNPPLLFCDEPTSGLDSFMAESVVTSLKKLASRGRTVICTIHQPSSQVFAMFDRVLLMAEGRVAYLGPTSDVCDFFLKVGSVCPANFSPADFYVHQLAIVPGRDTESRQFVQEVCSTYESSPQFAELLSEIQAAEDLTDSNEILVGNLKDRGSPYKSSRWTQFVAVLRRSWLTNQRDPTILRGRLMQTLVLLVLLGLIYFNQSYDQKGVMNINGCLFLMQMMVTIGNTITVLNTFPLEYSTLLREHHNAMYHVWIYYICKMIAELPIFLTTPVIFTFGIYWMVGLYHGAEAFFIATAAMVLVANVSISYGYMLSCSTNQLSLTMTLASIIIVPMILFGGFYLNSGSVPVYFLWLKYISCFSYSNEIMVVNQWRSVTSIECEYPSTNVTDLSERCFTDGQDVISSFNYSEDNIVEDFIVLLVLLVTLRLASYILLYLRTRKRE